jgi:quercetin 2,3-dioxygenase
MGLMWWNFVARTPQEVADARTDWEERRRFGDVTGYSGPRLVAPSLIVCESEPGQLIYFNVYLR